VITASRRRPSRQQLAAELVAVRSSVRGWRSPAASFASKRPSHQTVTVSKRSSGETGSSTAPGRRDQRQPRAPGRRQVEPDRPEPKPAGLGPADRVLAVRLDVDAALDASATGTARRSIHLPLAWDRTSLAPNPK
jgi:hypothetical protein